MFRILNVPRRFVRLGALLAATWGFTATAATNLLLGFDSPPGEVLETFHDAAWRSNGGNPSSGGFLSITDAINGQAGIVVLQDFDSGLVVKGFRFKADLRMGNPVGNDGRPADGLSINFARENDPILVRVDNGETPDGYLDSAGAHEIGTRTGIAVGFDTWPGNTLPDGPDIEGIIVRVDNVTVARIALPVRNGACNDTNSVQTGPYTADLNGAVDRLCWQPIEIELNEASELSVKWKGATMLDRKPITYVPSRGRIVFMGRTGIANQNTHIDNVEITTFSADQAFVSGVTPLMNGFDLRIEDATGSAVDTASIAVRLDESPVAVTTLHQANTTTVHYRVPAGGRLLSASVHSVETTYNDLAGSSFRDSRSFTIPTYGTFLSFSKVADANTLERGFRIRPHQVDFGQPNDLDWTEDQLAGRHGANRVNLSLAGISADADGYIAWDNKPIDFRNATGGAGAFSLDFSFAQVGLPGFNEDSSRINNEDHSALEILGFIEFAVAGAVTMNVASDDGFRLQSGPDPRDVLAERLGEFNSGRVFDSGTSFDVWVEEPGVYPFRMIWENGTGGAGLEWSAVRPDGTRSLVGNPADPLSLRTFRSRVSSPPYVAYVHPPPGGTQVHAQPDVTVVFENAIGLDSQKVRLTLDGQPLVMTEVLAGSQLRVTGRAPELLESNSVHTATLTYSPGASKTVTQSWTFRVIPYAAVLPTSTAGDLTTATNSGFRVRTWQIDPFPDQVDPTLRVPIHRSYAEAMLAGTAGPNVAHTANFTDNGYFAELGTINYAQQGIDGLPETVGHFGSEALIPGIPGLGSAKNDGLATEILTYVAFPTPGFYLFGVHSDDGLTVSPQHAAGELPLAILAPASLEGPMAAVPSERDDVQAGGVFGSLPQTPIDAEVLAVVGNHATAPASEGCGTALRNASALRGKIALVSRGTCGFLEKVRNAADAGALAVLVYNNRSDPPIVMGGDPNLIPIPALMIRRSDGERLATSTDVRARIRANSTSILASVNRERSASDTLFGFRVPLPGAYPIRLLWQENQGPASLEWFSIDADGVRRLLNDLSDPRSLRAFRQALVIPKPTVRIERMGLGAVLYYEGILQSAEHVGGPYADIPGAPINGPLTIPERDSAQFYRARGTP